jgi:hypothetical protein
MIIKEPSMKFLITCSILLSSFSVVAQDQQHHQCIYDLPQQAGFTSGSNEGGKDLERRWVNTVGEPCRPTAADVQGAALSMLETTGPEDSGDIVRDPEKCNFYASRFYGAGGQGFGGMGVGGHWSRGNETCQPTKEDIERIGATRVRIDPLHQRQNPYAGYQQMGAYGYGYQMNPYGFGFQMGQYGIHCQPTFTPDQIQCPDGIYKKDTSVDESIRSEVDRASRELNAPRRNGTQASEQ